VTSAAGDGTVKPIMSIKRQRKAQRRVARKRKTASSTKGPQYAADGTSARAVPHSGPVKLSDLLAIRASHQRGPGEELVYDYSPDDHGWFVVPRAGESFELPLTGELESNWELLAEQNPSCAPVAERISALRAAGRTRVKATLASVFWEALLPDGSTVCLESASDDEPASVICPELADGGPIGFWASELGFERFDGEVALPAYTWMTGETQAPVAIARRVGERWTDVYRVCVYDNATGDHEGIPTELCPPRERAR
jgi:hypothetical protein